MGKKKYSTAEIIAVVCCAIGLFLFVASQFIESEFDLFTIGLAFNGVGIMAFLFGRKPGKAE